MFGYRREIDGLRALAVVPVILFHAGFEAFSGGFVGVDVFFVISGYLITSIILTQKAAGTFSLLNFYERRARRILPALFLVMAVCIPFAWLWLLPSDMKDFSQSLVAVSVFASNVLFWKESGYFDTAAELKPLLHTWSLAVEEQYYVLFPLFLLVMWRFAKRWTVATLAVIAALSFALAQWGAYNKPAATFFLLPTRGWEIAIGALIAFYFARYPTLQLQRPAQEVGSLIGLSLILYAVFAYSKATPFPSAYALAPTLGTALIILCATPSTFVGRVLTTKLFVGVGLISYSAYLWHQPLFAFARQKSFTEPETTIYLALIVFCFSLAYATWRYVENPIRKSRVLERTTVFIASGLFTLLFILIGLTGHFYHGFENRFIVPETVKAQFKGHSLRSDCDKGDGGTGKSIAFCSLGSIDASDIKFALFGDSHANALNPMFNQIGLRDGIKYVHIGLGGCPPLLGIDVSKGNYEPGVCKALAERQFDYVRERKIKTVILVARWSLYTQGDYGGSMQGYFLISDDENTLSLQSSRKNFEESFRKTIQAYRGIGTRVIVLLQIPQQIVQPDKVYYKLYSFNRQETAAALNLIKELSVRLESHIELQRHNREYFRSLAEQDLIELIDPDPYFCSSTECLIGNARDSFYRDDDHVNALGAMRLIDAFDFKK